MKGQDKEKKSTGMWSRSVRLKLSRTQTKSSRSFSPAKARQHTTSIRIFQATTLNLIGSGKYLMPSSSVSRKQRPRASWLSSISSSGATRSKRYLFYRLRSGPAKARTPRRTCSVTATESRGRDDSSKRSSRPDETLSGPSAPVARFSRGFPKNKK